MVSSRPETDPPVLLVGFSAGAYLVMTAARELRAEGVETHRMGIIALGHTLFPSDRWGPPCDVPGVVIIGEREQLYTPYLNNLSKQVADNYCAEDGTYVNLADLPGGVLMDEIGASTASAGAQARQPSIAICPGPSPLAWSFARARRPTPSATTRGRCARGY